MTFLLLPRLPAYFSRLRSHILMLVSDKMSKTGNLIVGNKPLSCSPLNTGLYIMQVCLTGLFFLARNEAMEVSALPEGIMMIILIVFTALYQM